MTCISAEKAAHNWRLEGHQSASSALRQPEHHTSPSVPLSTQHRLHILSLCPRSLLSLLSLVGCIPISTSTSCPGWYLLLHFAVSENLLPKATALVDASCIAPMPRHCRMQIQHVLSSQQSQSPKKASSFLAVGFRWQMWHWLRSTLWSPAALYSTSIAVSPRCRSAVHSVLESQPKEESSTGQSAGLIRCLFASRSRRLWEKVCLWYMSLSRSWLKIRRRGSS